MEISLAASPVCLARLQRVIRSSLAEGRDDLLAAAAGLDQAGVFERLHQLLLARLPHAERLDWSRAFIDATHVGAPAEGPRREQVHSREQAHSMVAARPHRSA
jgi:hypothetical protein